MKMIIGNKVTSKIEKNPSIQKKVIHILNQINCYESFSDAVNTMKLHLINSPQFNYYVARINFDARLLLTYDLKENACFVVDIVHHKDLKKSGKHPEN